MSNIFIRVFMTTRFDNLFSGDSEDRLEEAKDWIESQWEDDIDVDENVYFIASDYKVDGNDLPYGTSLPAQRDAANDHLAQEFGDWNVTDAALVLDLFEQDDGDEYKGVAHTGGAIHDTERTAILDMSWSDEECDKQPNWECLGWSTPIDNILYHELGHLFGCDADHSTGRARYDETATVMALYYEFGCNSAMKLPEEKRRDYFSSCSVNEIENHF